MAIRQALVAIGGRASRMRRDGFPVAISKSFISLSGQPLLYWNLRALRQAGITRLILCADEPVQLHAAQQVLDRLPVPFLEVRLFSDEGLGVHGLPYQVISQRPAWLDESFVFECGHSLMAPEHYRRLVREKSQESIVFSAFKPHPSNLRQPVRLTGNVVTLLSPAEPDCHAIAHPIVADRRYAEQLPALRYDITRIIGHYGARSQLRYVFSDLPPEFDLLAELTAAMPVYSDYLATAPSSRCDRLAPCESAAPARRAGDLRDKTLGMLMPWTRSTRMRSSPPVATVP